MAAHSFSSDVIRHFRRAYPQVALQLKETNAPELTELTARGDIDVTMLRIPPLHRPGFIFDQLFDEEMVLALPRNHKLLRKHSARKDLRISLRELAAEKFVFNRRPGPLGMYANLVRACQRVGFMPHIAAEVDHMGSVINLVAAEVGLAVVPASMRGVHGDDVGLLPAARCGRRQCAGNARLSRKQSQSCGRQLSRHRAEACNSLQAGSQALNDQHQATIIVAARVAEGVRRELARHFRVLGPLGAPFAESVATLDVDDRKRVRAIVTAALMVIGRDAMKALPNLGLISCTGSGYDGVDLDAARELGVAVTNCLGVNAASVADLALGLFVATVRRVCDGNALVRRGEWPLLVKRAPTTLRGLTGRRVGIYGLGSVGEKIASRAVAFEMAVGYHNRKPRADVPYAYFDSLLELARWADVLVIAARASPENRHAVDRRILAALGSDAHVINVARGSLIDESALIDALRDGTIAGAGLDVVEGEPDVAPALLALPNVVFTPHFGGGTVEAELGRQQMVLANLRAFLSGSELANRVA